MIQLYVKFIPTLKASEVFIDNRFPDIHVNCEGIADPRTCLMKWVNKVLFLEHDDFWLCKCGEAYRG